jgi:IS30 family transposase
MSKYTHLSVRELQRIDYFFNLQHFGLREIGRELERSPSTISNVIKKYSRKASWKERKDIKLGYIKPVNYLLKNTCKKSLKGWYVFNWEYAEKRIREERSKCVKRHRIVVGSFIYMVIYFALRLGLKPDVIAGRTKLLGIFNISKQTIYNFIYSNPKLRLYEYLQKAKSKPTKRATSLNSSHIPHRVSIHERDKIIDERGRVGDFEADSIIGKRGECKTIINTMVDRKSRMVFISLAYDKTAANTYNAMEKKILNEIGVRNVKSITTDNGNEFYQQYKFNDMGIATYYADPYASYQRGTNERINGMIRKFFPKKKDFSDITEEEIMEVQDYLNNLPRKILGYKTPLQVWNENVGE